MKRTVNRIPYLVAGLIVAGMGGYLLGWSYYRDAIGQIFPMWSQGELSLPFTIHNVTVCLMLLVAGQALKKLSNRTVIVIGGLSLIIGFSLIPFIPKENPTGALVMLVICYGVVAAISPAAGTAAGYDAFLAWFPERQGFVSGLLTFFCGIAPILVGFLCGLLLGVFLAVKELHALGADFRCVAVVAVLIRPLTGPQAAFDVDGAAFMEVVLRDFGQAVEKHDAMPFGFGNRLAVAIAVAARRRQAEGGDGKVGLARITNLGVLTEIAQKDDLIDRSHDLKSL